MLRKNLYDFLVIAAFVIKLKENEKAHEEFG